MMRNSLHFSLKGKDKPILKKNKLLAIIKSLNFNLAFLYSSELSNFRCFSRALNSEYISLKLHFRNSCSNESS